MSVCDDELHYSLKCTGGGRICIDMRIARSSGGTHTFASVAAQEKVVNAYIVDTLFPLLQKALLLTNRPGERKYGRNPAGRGHLSNPPKRRRIEKDESD